MMIGIAGTIRQDMRTMLEETEARGVELPVVASSLACYEACSGFGSGAGDPAMEIVFWLNRSAAKLN